jgi:hypothetical protein
MTEATLVLANDGFGRSAAGLVYGGLYLQIDQFQFPNPRWTDFVVVVLAWWCRALSRLLAGESAPVEVRFMEGPYLAEIASENMERVHLKLVDAGLNRRVRLEVQVSADVLIDSVLAAATRALAECKVRGWWSHDASELADAIKALQRETLKTKN